MSDVIVEDRGPVRWMTLNRPRVLNAITRTMLRELSEAFKAAETDPGVRVVVLTGAGNAFCSSLDLKQAAAGGGLSGELSPGSGAQHFSTTDICTVVLHRMDKPVIAAINGPAAGYGLDLALGCDLRLIARSAHLSPGFAGMGIVPESGGTWYLPRLLGWAKACEVAMLHDRIGAEEAVSIGLANSAEPDAHLLEVAATWADRIAARAPLAIMEMKRLFRHGQTQDFESHSHHVLMSLLNLLRSNDFKEGVQAFAERRKPAFSGT